MNDIFSLLKFIFDDYTLPSSDTVRAKLNFLIFTHFRMSTPHKFILDNFSILYRCSSLFIGLFSLIGELIVMFFQGCWLNFKIILKQFSVFVSFRHVLYKEKQLKKKSSANQRLFNVPITESNEVYCTAIVNIKN